MVLENSCKNQKINRDKNSENNREKKKMKNREKNKKREKKKTEKLKNCLEATENRTRTLTVLMYMRKYNRKLEYEN